MERLKRGDVDMTPKRKRGMLGFFVVLVLVGVVVIGGSVMLGKSDSGVIDVSDVISKSNVQSAESGNSEQVTVPNQTFQNLPNGGLVPLGEQPKVEENQSQEVDTATTTTATTTEDGREATETGSGEPAEASTDTSTDTTPVTQE